MAKTYKKANESFRILSNGVRDISENVRAKSCVSVLRGRKKIAHKPWYQLTKVLVSILFLFH